MQVCTLLQPDNHASTPPRNQPDNHAKTTPLCFLQAGCPSCRPTNSISTEGITAAAKNIKKVKGKGKGSPYSITERRVPELIPVLGSQPAGDVSHKPGGRLPLLSTRPAVTPATLKRAATNFAAW